MNNAIDIFYDVFSYEENLLLQNKIISERNFRHGERDVPEFPPLGMTCELTQKDPLFYLFESKILERNIKLGPLRRSYINLFLPVERPFFHTDGDVKTILFYLNPKVDYNQNGETQFIIDNSIKGILPIPGSMICFDGMILHRATSFRSIPRVTVAFKYSRC